MILSRARKFQKPCRFSLPRQFPPHPGNHAFVDLAALVRSERPAWKLLISRPLDMGERISLITTIFSDNNQVEKAGRLTGDDAQTFIDTIDEVVPARSHVQSTSQTIQFPTFCQPGDG